MITFVERHGTQTLKGEPMRTFETSNGSRTVVTTNQNTGGEFQSRLYVDFGNVATLTSASHKTEAGARRWAEKKLSK